MLSNKTNIILAMVGVVAMVAFVGCGGGVDSGAVPVSGVVTLDGSPLEGATVTFAPASAGGKAASGVTDATGKYQLTTLNPNDGALPGSYNVGVTKLEGGGQDVDLSGLSEEEATAKAMEMHYKGGGADAAVSKQGAKAAKNLIPQKYSMPKSSGLKADVPDSGSSELNFDLTGG